jgi:hypothetical protein
VKKVLVQRERSAQVLSEVRRKRQVPPLSSEIAGWANREDHFFDLLSDIRLVVAVTSVAVTSGGLWIPAV